MKIEENFEQKLEERFDEKIAEKVMHIEGNVKQKMDDLEKVSEKVVKIEENFERTLEERFDEKIARIFVRKMDERLEKGMKEKLECKKC